MQIQIDTTIQLSVNSQLIGNSYYSHVIVTPPSEAIKRQKVGIICVLDISGSMDSEATQGQSKESDGFSRLDLVKHSVNTIVHSLQDGDYLGIVTFSDQARTDLHFTQMNKHGKDQALAKIKAMKTEGSTNLWAGIHAGLELTKSPTCDNLNTFVVVLTDGQPNKNPPEGNIGALKKYIDANPLTCSMSLFGYGYNLDTPLLSQMSEMGAGCYGYIPDCSMVGTIFVNFLSNSLSTFTTLMTASVQVNKGTFIALNGSKSTNSLMGPMQYGQPRNILLECSQVNDGDQFATLHIKYGKNLRLAMDLPLKMKTVGNTNQLKSQILRYQYINFLENATQKANANQLNVALDSCNSLVGYMKKIHSESKDEYLEALIRDIESVEEAQGQVSKALQNQQWWQKWGRHYFPALKIAHYIEMCTNFKDPGLQKYCGLLFRQIQNIVDTIFIQLPPPNPTIKKYDQKGNVRQVRNMAHYYNNQGGCIAGHCQVLTIQGNKKIQDLTAADYVQTTSGFSKIKCVLVTDVNAQIQMVKLKSGLLITNYHPIIHNGEWVFPIHIQQPHKIYIHKYYNFVLEKDHRMIVNGIQCATLGHGIKGKIIEHSYLGTEAIIHDLQKLRGWGKGQVTINTDMVKRDPISKLIIGITI